MEDTTDDADAREELEGCTVGRVGSTVCGPPKALAQPKEEAEEDEDDEEEEDDEDEDEEDEEGGGGAFATGFIFIVGGAYAGGSGMK